MSGRSIAAVVAVAVFGVGCTLFIFLASRHPLFITEVTAVHAVDSSHVRVSWFIENKGFDAGHLKTCTIQLGSANGTVLGSWTGAAPRTIAGNTTPRLTTIVKVPQGSANSVNFNYATVSCQ